MNAGPKAAVESRPLPFRPRSGLGRRCRGVLTEEVTPAPATLLVNPLPFRPRNRTVGSVLAPTHPPRPSWCPRGSPREAGTSDTSPLSSLVKPFYDNSWGQAVGR